jgi:hypothetical protein
MSVKIRPYSPADRQAVRDICCATGFMGEPIDPIFNDRDAFADFFTSYYTDFEPDNALVAEHDGRIVGYLLGGLDYSRCSVRQLWIILTRTAPKVLAHLLMGRYSKASLRYLGWFLTRAAHETPRAIPDAAHFHINLLPAYRTGKAARRLIFSFVNRVAKLGFKGVYGQMQVYQDRREEKIFQRYGFRFADRRQTTKFRHVHAAPVWVATIYHEFMTREAPMRVMT